MGFHHLALAVLLVALWMPLGVAQSTRAAEEAQATNAVARSTGAAAEAQSTGAAATSQSTRAAAQSADAAAPATAPAPLLYAEVVEKARALVRTDLAERGYPGIAIAVAVDGETVWSEGFGYANLEHRVPMQPSVKFRVGSISKSLTAAAVAKLVEDGRLDLDAPIQRYVPSFPEKAHPVTARQLGGHLAGIRHYQGNENFIRDPYPTVLDGVAIFADDPAAARAGHRVRLHEPRLQPAQRGGGGRRASSRSWTTCARRSSARWACATPSPTS